jgi:hypothetical protein
LSNIGISKFSFSLFSKVKLLISSIILLIPSLSLIFVKKYFNSKLLFKLKNDLNFAIITFISSSKFFLKDSLKFTLSILFNKIKILLIP